MHKGQDPPPCPRSSNGTRLLRQINSKQQSGPTDSRNPQELEQTVTHFRDGQTEAQRHLVEDTHEELQKPGSLGQGLQADTDDPQLGQPRGDLAA